MSVKNLLVAVELAIREVTCPGVWLCSNGKLSLQIHMLDSVIQTDCHKPIFPILFNEKYIFYKTFSKERRLTELQRSLGREFFSADLIQWKNCTEGVILASFCTPLDDLLYPYASNSSNRDLTGNVELLMKPTNLFPGTISPKLELHTQTSIEETFAALKHIGPSGDRNNKKGCFSQNCLRKIHPTKVCHTVAYSKAQQRCLKIKVDKKPIFKYKKPEDSLILRMNPNKLTNEQVVRTKDKLTQRNNTKVIDESFSCYCSDCSALTTQEATATNFVKRIDKNDRKQHKKVCDCPCCLKNRPNLCPLCSKYLCTFSTISKDFERSADTLKLCSYCQENFATRRNCTCKVTRSDSQLEKRVCFCLPGERVSNLVNRLHEKVMNTLNVGSATIESCHEECAIYE